MIELLVIVCAVILGTAVGLIYVTRLLEPSSKKPESPDTVHQSVNGDQT